MHTIRRAEVEKAK